MFQSSVFLPSNMPLKCIWLFPVPFDKFWWKPFHQLHLHYQSLFSISRQLIYPTALLKNKLYLPDLSSMAIAQAITSLAREAISFELYWCLAYGLLHMSYCSTYLSRHSLCSTDLCFLDFQTFHWIHHLHSSEAHFKISLKRKQAYAQFALHHPPVHSPVSSWIIYFD